MTQRTPAEEALHDLRAEIGPDGTPAATQAWSSFLRCARRRYATPRTPDSDGLLFQYGIVPFHGPEIFVLDLTRQFEAIDADGDHDHYVHVHCALHYAPNTALRNLSSFNSWFFHDADQDLDEWSAPLSDLEIWNVLRHQSPVDTRIELETV
ncbi:hypothetical protein [Spirillospora sp. NPDC029432]|uniref:hypothetical protein n=1 Tax=Spirillospora sp. NPDC029432 TaxID=3154599 RepID=UPI003456A741